MNDFQKEQLQTALEYNAQGFNVLPLIYGKKKPSEKWKHWQTKLQTANDVQGMFGRPENKNIGILGGPASGNLSVVDFDSMTAFKDCRRPFETLLSHTPAVKTVRGVHVYVRTSDPLNTGKLYKDGKNVGDLKAEGGYVVAPNSLLKAKTNHQYSFWDDFDEVTVLEPWELFNLLTVAGITVSQSAKKKESAEAFKDLINPGLRTCRISPALFDAVFKHPVKGFRSEAEQSLIFRLYCIGWGFYEVQELFRREGERAGTHYREYRKEQRETYLKRCWNNAATHYETKAPELYRTLDVIRDNGAALFTGRTADTDRAVLFAIFQKCRETGLYTPQASQREIAERAGVQRLTAMKAINRLQSADIIRYTAPAEVTHTPRTVELNAEKLLNICGYTKLIPYIHISPVLGCRGIEAEQAADLFRYGALGKKGQILLKALEQGKANTKELNQKTGIKVRVLKRIMKRATGAGIVIQIKAGQWQLNPKVDVTEAARRLGVDGKGEKQRERHKAERTQFKTYLSTVKTRQGDR